MTFKRNILSFSTSIAMLSMVGCGVTSQDGGSGSGAAVSGLAVDGYVAGGVAYVDTNENFELDVWEPRAFTDARGYFTYSPAITDSEGNVIQEAVPYCDLAKTDASYQFCLKIPASYDEVLVRVTKGYDLSTGEPFVGTLTMKMTSNASDLTQLNVVSPITGLLAKMSPEEKTSFLDIEGLPNLESVDFMDFSDTNISDTQRANILSLALLIHNVSNIAGQQIAEVLHSSVTESNPSKPSIEGVTPQQAAKADAISLNSFTVTASDSVLNALLTFMKNKSFGGKVSSLLAAPDSGFETLVLADMQAKLRARAKDTAAVIPDVDPDLASIVTNVKNMRSVVVWSITDKPDDMTFEEFVKAKLRVTEVVSSLIKNKKDANAIINAVAMSSNSDFLKNLANDKADVNNLKKLFVEREVFAVDADYSDRQCFAEFLKGSASANGLSGTDPDLTDDEPGVLNTDGLAGNTLKMSEGADGVEVVFSGTSKEAEKGGMKIFATFSEGDYAKLVDGVPVAQEFSGTWNQLDPCTMLLKVNVAGVIESVIVKPTRSNSANAYNFDLGGEQRVWVPKQD